MAEKGVVLEVPILVLNLATVAKSEDRYIHQCNGLMRPRNVVPKVLIYKRVMKGRPWKEGGGKGGGGGGWQSHLEIPVRATKIQSEVMIGKI